jgi:acyl carrier protein
MGLDSLELLLKVEETFEIKIPDPEAERIITISDFHNSVWQHLSGRHSDKCHTQGLFYKLRQSFIDAYKLPRNIFGLDSSPNDLFPKSNRRQSYLKFAEMSNLKLPDLALSTPWDKVLTTFGIATIIGGLLLSLVLIIFFDYSRWSLLFCIAGILLTIGFSKLLNPKRIIIKSQTIKDFTKETLALNYSTLVKVSGINRQEMESVMNHIIADQIGLELEEITPEKKIHDDLGVD